MTAAACGRREAQTSARPRLNVQRGDEVAVSTPSVELTPAHDGGKIE